MLGSEDQELYLKNKRTATNPAIIRVIGVGGAGCNAVEWMKQSGLENVDLIAVNTDAQALANLQVDTKIQIGKKTTNGLGAGSNPAVGEKAAQEDIEVLKNLVIGADMVFITAGMGGGTGTGAAPVIAKISKEAGILTVAVVTKPFEFEGKRRMAIAEEGIAKLKEYVDTLIVISNQNLMRLAQKNLTVVEAFKLANEVLKNSVQGITDIITKPGLINVDFADVRTVLQDKGDAIIGIGEDTEPKNAAIKAVTNPLVENFQLRQANSILVNISSAEVEIAEMGEIMEIIKEALHVGDHTLIIPGLVEDRTLKDRIRVTVIATGKREEEKVEEEEKWVEKSLEIPNAGKDINKKPQVNKKRFTLEEFENPSLTPSKEDKEVHKSNIYLGPEYTEIPTFYRKKSNT